MKPTKNRHYCIGCQRPKMLFETQEKADSFMRFNNSAMVSKLHKIPARSYYCSFCCGWHITSVSDEEFAKTRDEKDVLLWESIRVAAKVTNLRVKTSETIVAKSQEKPPKPKKEKPEPSEEEKQSNGMINQIHMNMVKATMLLKRVDYESSRIMIEDSECIYKKAMELIDKYNLPTLRLQAARAKIDKLTLLLNSLMSLRNNTERQQELIEKLEGKYEDKAYRSMLISLKYRERILRYVDSVKSAMETNNHDEARKILSEMMLFVVRYRLHTANRKWARTQIAIAKRIIKWESLKTMNLQERFLSIIDTVERAKALLECDNTEDAMALAESAQSEIDDIECNYIELIERCIRLIKKAASKVDMKGTEETLE